MKNERVRTGVMMIIIFTIMFSIVAYSYAVKVQAEREVKDLNDSINFIIIKLEELRSEKSTLEQSLRTKSNQIKSITDSYEVKVDEIENRLDIMTLDFDNLKKENSSLKSKNSKLSKELEESISNKSNSKTPIVSGTAVGSQKDNSTKTVSRGGGTVTEGFQATFYNAGFASTGKNPGDSSYGITKSGRKVESGVTIAVDPKVIPLGSWVKITMPDGTVLKRRADDTGSAIRGRIIDIFMDVPTKELYELGRVRGVKVEIIN